MRAGGGCKELPPALFEISAISFGSDPRQDSIPAIASKETDSTNCTMARKRKPNTGSRVRSPARGVARAPRPAPRRGSRAVASRPKRLIVIVILLLIGGLLIKRAGTPVHAHPRVPLSAGARG